MAESAGEAQAVAAHDPAVAAHDPAGATQHQSATAQAQAAAAQARAADPNLQPLDPRPLRHVHHGQTAAMWTTVVIELVGFLVGGVSLLLGPAWWLFAVAVGICIVGIIVGVAMQKLGLGIYEKHHQNSDHQKS